MHESHSYIRKFSVVDFASLRKRSAGILIDRFMTWIMGAESALGPKSMGWFLQVTQNFITTPVI